MKQIIYTLLVIIITLFLYNCSKSIETSIWTEAFQIDSISIGVMKLTYQSLEDETNSSFGDGLIEIYSYNMKTKEVTLLNEISISSVTNGVGASFSYPFLVFNVYSYEEITFTYCLNVNTKELIDLSHMQSTVTHTVSNAKGDFCLFWDKLIDLKTDSIVLDSLFNAFYVNDSMEYVIGLTPHRQGYRHIYKVDISTGIFDTLDTLTRYIVPQFKIFNSANYLCFISLAPSEKAYYVPLDSFLVSPEIVNNPTFYTELSMPKGFRLPNLDIIDTSGKFYIYDDRKNIYLENFTNPGVLETLLFGYVREIN